MQNLLNERNVHKILASGCGLLEQMLHWRHVGVPLRRQNLQRVTVFKYDSSCFGTAGPKIGCQQFKTPKLLIGHRQISAWLGVIRQSASRKRNQIPYGRNVFVN